MTSPEFRDANPYAPPTSEPLPAKSDGWTVRAVFLSGLRRYRGNPFGAIIALGLIPTLSTLPLDFWRPTSPWVVALQFAISNAMFALFLPGETSIALSISSGSSWSLQDYIRRIHMAPKLFILFGLPLSLAFLPFTLFPEEGQGIVTDAELYSALLAFPLSLAGFYVLFRLTVASYALVDRGHGVRDAAATSWRWTGVRWTKYLLLFIASFLLSLVPLSLSWDGPSVSGTVASVILTPLIGLSFASAYLADKAEFGSDESPLRRVNDA